MPPIDSSGVGPETRRSVLRRIGLATTAIGTTGLAGCSGDDEPSGPTDGESSDSGDGNDGESADSGDGEDGTATETASSGDESIVVGHVLPFSGAYAGLAESGQRGAELAIDQLNSDGGINGREVEPVFEDTQLDPQTGRQKARKLIEDDGADALFGEPAGSVSLAIAEEAADANVPFFTMSSTSALTMEECRRTTFRYQPRMIETGVWAPWCLDEFGTDVHIHFADYVWGQNTSGFWTDAMDDRANIVGETKSQVGASDFSTYVSQIQASNPDWVFAALAGGDAVNFLKQAASFDLQSQVNIVGPLNAYQTVREGAGNAAADTYSVVSYYEEFDSERNQEFVSNFKSMHEIPPDNSAEVAYTHLQMYAAAVAQAGTTAGDDAIKALEAVEYDAPMGTATYRECDHQARRSLYMGRITDQSQYDWPGIEILDSIAGEDVMTPCNETDCSF